MSLELKPIQWGAQDRELAGLVASEVKKTMSWREYRLVIDPWWPVRKPPAPPIVRRATHSLLGTVLIFAAALVLLAFGRG